MKLTESKIRRIRKRGHYSDGHNLVLQWAGPNNRSWIFRFSRGGKERMMGLGALHVLNLEDARELARAARKLLLAGIDPLEHRRASRAQQVLTAAKTKTFEASAREYFEAHRKKWKSAKHTEQFLNALTRHVFPKIGGVAVAAIDTALVLKCIEPIWHNTPETASRVRARIEQVLDWATVRGDRAAGDNPARWRGHLAHLLPARAQIKKVVHHAALPHSEIYTLMTELAALSGVRARALELTILCATRTSETLGARWDEINLAQKLWTIPAERMKTAREHRIPLPDRAVSLLAALPRTSDLVFGSLGELALADVLKKRLRRRAYTVHGMRSTFRNWGSERTSYPNHVLELALAHHVGSAVERAYRRTDLLEQRAKLMADWARFCSEPPRDTAVVTPIRQVRV